MERKNMLTLGIVAVVIVIVLAGTYLCGMTAGTMMARGTSNWGTRCTWQTSTSWTARRRDLSEMYAAATIDGNTYFVYQSNLGEYRVVT